MELVDVELVEVELVEVELVEVELVPPPPVEPPPTEGPPLLPPVEPEKLLPPVLLVPVTALNADWVAGAGAPPLMSGVAGGTGIRLPSLRAKACSGTLTMFETFEALPTFCGRATLFNAKAAGAAGTTGPAGGASAAGALPSAAIALGSVAAPNSDR